MLTATHTQTHGHMQWHGDYSARKMIEFPARNLCPAPSHDRGVGGLQVKFKYSLPLILLLHCLCTTLPACLCVRVSDRYKTLPKFGNRCRHKKWPRVAGGLCCLHRRTFDKCYCRLQAPCYRQQSLVNIPAWLKSPCRGVETRTSPDGEGGGRTSAGCTGRSSRHREEASEWWESISEKLMADCAKKLGEQAVEK